MTSANPVSSMERARATVKRKAGAPYTADLIADNGSVFDNTNPGFVWVREILGHEQDTGATVYGDAYQVRSIGTFPIGYGQPVRVEYDPIDDEWGVVRADFDEMVRRNINPAIANPLNPYIHFTDLSSLLPLLSFAVANGNTDTTEVGVKNFFYLDYTGTLQTFSIDPASRPDIGDSEPGTGLKRLVHLWLQWDNTIGVSLSTPINAELAFNITVDLAECLNSPPDPFAIPIAAWKMENGQPAMTEADLIYDTRQWINTTPPRGVHGFPTPVDKSQILKANRTLFIPGDLTITDDFTILGNLTFGSTDTRVTSEGGTFGDHIAGDYSNFEDTGFLRYEGSAQAWDDMRIPGLAVQLGASSPDLISFLAAGDLKIYGFNGNATEEEVHFTVQLPHTYAQGTDIEPHVHWSAVNANAGDVVWQLEYTWANINGTFPASTTITATDSASGTAWDHQVIGFSAITGTSKNISSMLVCRLFRDPTDGSDTYASDAAFLEFDFHFQIDTIGSRQEFIK